MICPHCKYEFKNRTAKPKKCPLCQRWLNKPARLIALLGLSLLVTACTKHPDKPAPQQAATTTPQPLPVNHCQSATVVVNMPVYVQASGTQQTSTVAGFDLGCGDSLEVLIKNTALASTDPWTTLLNDPNGSSYYTLSGQQVTVFNNTGSQVYVAINAVLK